MDVLEVITPEAASSAASDDLKQVSQVFLDALYLYTRKVRPQWQLATFVGVSPEYFSRLVNGRVPLCAAGEARIVQAGALLGLEPEDCFE